MGAESGRTVLVVGALGGLATCLVQDLVAQGDTVVGVDRLPERDGWMDQVDPNGTGSVTIDVVDATSEDAVRELAANLARQGRHVDAVVNTAGMTIVNDIWSMESKYWHRVMDVNLTSTFLLTRQFIKPMIDAGWGRIVTFASVYAYRPTYGQAAYAAAKAAVIGFTRSVAADVARYGVTVNAVAPGVVWHPALLKTLPAEHMAQLKAGVPAGKFGDPRHISSTVRYLLSEGAGYTTGQTIHVNGAMFPGG